MQRGSCPCQQQVLVCDTHTCCLQAGATPSPGLSSEPGISHSQPDDPRSREEAHSPLILDRQTHTYIDSRASGPGPWALPPRCPPSPLWLLPISALYSPCGLRISSPGAPFRRSTGLASRYKCIQMALLQAPSPGPQGVPPTPSPASPSRAPRFSPMAIRPAQTSVGSRCNCPTCLFPIAHERFEKDVKWEVGVAVGK